MSSISAISSRAALASPTLGQSGESEQLVRIWIEAAKHFREPASRAVSQEDELEQLAGTWRQDTRYVSSLSDKVLHPAYQRIIGTGPAALPFLLRCLERKPEHWFWALEAITGINPVPPEDRGRVKRMAEAWVKWGRQTRKI